ncbi:hypothetical protein Tco_1101328 [Tanacetum coccineum]
MSDSEHSTVSYTSISSDPDPSTWGITFMDVDKEMDPYEEVAQQGQAAPPSPAYAPDPMELEDHVPVYVLEPAYPEYLDEEDLEEDPADYPADGGDDDDDESSDDQEDEEEEEEHLAPADFTAAASLVVDPVPSVEETDPFKTDESVVTPPPPPPVYHTTARMFIRAQTPISFPSEAEAALCYKAARIRLRAALPLPLPVPSTSRRADIAEANILHQKSLILTAPTPRFEVGESFTAAATRQSRSTMARGVDYSFVDTVDASVRASERRTMAAIEMQDAQKDHAALRGEVDTLRRYLSSLCTTHEQERVEARQALARSEAHNRALEARIIVLETQAHRHEWQRQVADDHATGAMMRIQVLEARARIDTLEDTGRSV